RRAAHALGGDAALDRVVAVRAGNVDVRAIAHTLQATLDDLRVGEADGHVITGRTELLEITRLTDTQERVVRLLAVQSVPLQPLLAARDAVGGGRRDHAVASGHHVGDHRLTGERRERLAVALEARARDDGAGDAGLRRIVGTRARIGADRAGI